jgi:hypothetical protein
MDKRHIAVDKEMTESEDLNVSNLLVTKSERAPKTELPKAQDKHGSELVRVLAVGVLGSLAVGMAIWIGRQLILRPHTIASERM